jgi:hypothetical protein
MAAQSANENRRVSAPDRIAIGSSYSEPESAGYRYVIVEDSVPVMRSVRPRFGMLSLPHSLRLKFWTLSLEREACFRPVHAGNGLNRLISLLIKDNPHPKKFPAVAVSRASARNAGSAALVFLILTGSHVSCKAGLRDC